MGGLAVLWAEENSRESLFAAMRRREAYGTSGPRIALRFFAGFGLPDDLCASPDFASLGYAAGVPMGGDLVRRPGDPETAPRFAVAALRDPGAPGQPGVPLERIQIVKGWIEDGTPREAVYDVAGEPVPGSDLATCEPPRAGRDQLCSVFTDPDFDAGERAYWYARVLEPETCRWHWRTCRANGVDCSAPGGPGEGFEACCDPEVPKTVRERAWSSPIWYTPPSAGAGAR